MKHALFSVRQLGKCTEALRRPCFSAHPRCRTLSTTMVAAAADKSSQPTAASFEGLEVPEDVQPLFQPWKIGRYELTNRIVYAPLTRCRALNTVPQPQAATYYAQRTTPGALLISEATCICTEGHGYPHTPGIYTEEQIEAWKPIVKAVHDKGGVFFLQLWHVGRASHPDYQPDGQAPVSSSAVAIKEPWTVFTTKGGPFPYPTPRPLDISEIPKIVDLYAQAARNAIAAGFDGVEIHGANGYLIDQFIKDGINSRTDKYGGSIENRIRFALEVTEAVTAAVGADRVGIRISPFTVFLDAVDSTPYSTHMKLVTELNKHGLAYVHFIEPRVPEMTHTQNPQDSLAPFKEVAQPPVIVAGGYTRTSGAAAVCSGHTDAIAYGRIFLANPDLPKRFVLDAELNRYDRATFYSQGQEGYTDYPTLEEALATAKA